MKSANNYFCFEKGELHLEWPAPFHWAGKDYSSASDYLKNSTNNFNSLLIANFGKFSQNPHLLDKLLKTKNDILVYCDPEDYELGCGLSHMSQLVEDPLEWKGQNQLGFCLGIVRNKLTPKSNEKIDYSEKLRQDYWI